MEWGTYKPNQFFGIKNRDPEPITVGMAWVVPGMKKGEFDVKHSYKYESNNGEIAYYEFHDGWSSSKQVIEDPRENARIEIEFTKQVKLDDNENVESSWQALISIQRINPKKILGMVPFIYLSSIKGGIKPQQKSHPIHKDQTHVLKIVRNLPDNYNEYFEFMNIGENVNGSTVMGVHVEEEQIWNVESLFRNNMREILLGGQQYQENANFVIMRLPKIKKESSFFISYKKKRYSEIDDVHTDSFLMRKSESELIDDFKLQMQIKRKSFDNKFASVFKLNQERFDNDPILNQFKEKGLQFSKEALSNLLGGIGYYYGPVLIRDRNRGSSYDEPAELFTGSPSRSRFPRGFLWDEGFHLTLTCQWSKLLCMDILSHWFNSMKSNGWIPREQIRGPEAESNVPREFIVQDPKVANPPSMMFPMKFLLQEAQKGDKKITFFVSTLYQKWQTWYQWFFKSQENPSMPFNFSWRGRTSQENFPSGLDDYPRGFIVNEGYEIHLDLQSWMVEFSKFMSLYATLAEDQKSSVKYQFNAKRIEEELHEKLLNPNTNLYADYLGLQFEPILLKNGGYAEKIEWRIDLKCGENAMNSLKQPAKCNHPYSNDEFKNNARCCIDENCIPDPDCSCSRCEQFRSIDDDYNTQLGNSYSVHEGIINFWPIMFGLVNDNQTLHNHLSLLGDPTKMLSNSGIRSLSKMDQFYQYGSNYWRGAIWINVNYLVLRGLFKFYQSDETIINQIPQYKVDPQIQTQSELYQIIRQRLIQTVYKNWSQNHLFWEQYDNESGVGTFTKPFTGWTALILLIVSENYV
ncbi:mannosyl-oligosaccharide glucosidase [Stylonychia lemnae]|uniref:Mannosyl-oligosaccharide glucosidase n=1 Tax=Stylonychia lemnae TaxID=5949 RepID=A0A078AEN7_STYLE|nr:mannosyl-oligosaccharide glucosidase [Stylonychia lemnae]|eukprot:CDW80734.1 mannosyl-oligosaccharide glucosidase [Stylonychia lemnae]